MFTWWGALMARHRVGVLSAVLLAVLASGGWGLGVFDLLREGGYADPDSESSRAVEAARDALGPPGGDVVLIYTVDAGTVDAAGVGDRVERVLGALPAEAVTTYATYWQSLAPQLASADRRSAVAVLTMAGDDDDAKLDGYLRVKDDLDVPGTTVQVAGETAVQEATAVRSTRDLAFAEAVSLPFVLLLLLLIFGSLVAASLPVLVGGCAVFGSLGVLHAIALATDVNSFAVNVASLIGLGMAIDYGLFIVGRFREEQAAGRSPADAVARTVGTAGRTVFFSATLLTVAFSGLLLFPQGMLKSLAYGGMAAVVLAATMSLTLLPAVLALLGPWVERLPVRIRRRPRRTGAHSRQAPDGWAGLAGYVMRRPVVVILPIVAFFAVLIAPVAQVRFGEVDERTLPPGDPSRQAVEALQRDFPTLGGDDIRVVLRGTSGQAPDLATGQAFQARVADVPGVTQVDPTAGGGDVLLLTVTLADPDPLGETARDAVHGVRALAAPPGTEILVAGSTARNLDSLAATARQLPWMIALLVTATLVLMFFAFGSILLPVKAVVLSAVSLLATFGSLIWIFQLGYLADLLGVTPAPLEVAIVVLMGAVVFGLSTDYEVFLLSRMVEARARGASTEDAVTIGLVRTGRVITAAALLLIVVTGAFALATISTMRFIGIGMIIALVLDATVVRVLLVPAVIRLLDDRAWWAPPMLRRLQQRAGLSEVEAEVRPTFPLPGAASGPGASSVAPDPPEATEADAGDGPEPAERPAAPHGDNAAPHGDSAAEDSAGVPSEGDKTPPDGEAADAERAAAVPVAAQGGRSAVRILLNRTTAWLAKHGERPPPAARSNETAAEEPAARRVDVAPVADEPAARPRTGRHSAQHAGGKGGFTYGKGRDWESANRQHPDAEDGDGERPTRRAPQHLRR